MKLLNVGCGRHYHPDWINVDLVASGPDVQEHDLRQGLPFADNTFDAVYHSHVLEHLKPADAKSMLLECQRVLKPGGVLRVVVPDLEGIAREYLRTLEIAASNPNSINDANHRWMTLELIDQMTREKIGGEMGAAMRDEQWANKAFIQSRIGYELHGNGVRKRISLPQKLSRLVASVRKRMACLAVRLIDGETGAIAYCEGRFRQSGEIHRWMYDRVSLCRLLAECGFENPQTQRAETSRIQDFDTYQLDRDGSSIRKPDSLFVEANKVTVTASESKIRIYAA